MITGIRTDPDARYMSTAGTLSDHQREVIRQAIPKMPPDSTIVLAFDNDKGGKGLAEGGQALAPAATFERPLPSVGKDWNDVLVQRERDYILALEDVSSLARSLNADRER